MSERKPDGQRVRRASPEIAWTDLPAGGRVGPPPSVPFGFELGQMGCLLWVRAWQSPEATQWGNAEAELLAARCQLEDQWHETRDVKLRTEMRHIDVALGRTAKARKELRWRVVAEQVDESAGVAPRARRLKVVGG